MQTLFALLAALASLASASTPSTESIFKNPLMTRVYQQTAYTLKGKDVWEPNDVSIADVASSLAAMKPSYVSGTIRLAYNVNLTQDMITDFHTIRSRVLSDTPTAKFDIELNLDPDNPPPGTGYPSSAAVVAQMRQLNSQLPIDGWWFDYLSTAQSKAPDWVVAVSKYARSQNQTIGGNVFGTAVPPAIDAVAFVDGRGQGDTSFGYGIDEAKVRTLQANAADADGTLVLGHLNNNPQENQDTTECCVYMRNFTATERADYLKYWTGEASKLGFTYMVPLFFPLCPGASSYSPLEDAIPGTNKTVFDRMKAAALARVG